MCVNNVAVYVLRNVGLLVVLLPDGRVNVWRNSIDTNPLNFHFHYSQPRLLVEENIQEKPES